MTPEAVYRFIGGRGNPPAVLGRKSGPLLIIGGGRCVWDDIASPAAKSWGGDVMAINDIGQYYHGVVHHWVTLHPEYMAGWRFFRERHCYGEGKRAATHSNNAKPEIDHAWDCMNLGGCSGLWACHVALMLGYDRILLAGVPMDNTGHFFDAPHYQSAHVDEAQDQVWGQSINQVFAGRVSSCSGRTREWLGEKRVAA